MSADSYVLAAGSWSAIPGLAALVRPIGGRIVVVVVGSEADAQVASEAGVDAVVRVAVPVSGAPECAADTVIDLVQQAGPALVVAPTGATERVLLGAVAGRLGLPVMTSVSAASMGENGVQVTHTVFGGIVERTEEAAGTLLLSTDPVARVEPSGDVAPIETRSVAAQRMTVTGSSPATHAAADLSVADRVVAVGRGLKAEPDLALMRNLADVLHAELGCSRPLAEGLDWLPKDRYIGMSGRRVSPALYLAVGISGQLQHMSGARGAGLVVAVNSDPKAPIFAECDYGVVGDLYEVVPALTAALGG